MKIDSTLQSSIEKHRVAVEIPIDETCAAYNFSMDVSIDKLTGKITLEKCDGMHGKQVYQFTNSKAITIQAFIACAEKALAIAKEVTLQK